MRKNTPAQETNLSAKTIRYYEAVGLLPPPKRLDNGYRDYESGDIALARFVAGARILEFSINDIKEIRHLTVRSTYPVAWRSHIWNRGRATAVAECLAVASCLAHLG